MNILRTHFNQLKVRHFKSLTCHFTFVYFIHFSRPACDIYICNLQVNRLEASMMKTVSGEDHVIVTVGVKLVTKVVFIWKLLNGRSQMLATHKILTCYCYNFYTEGGNLVLSFTTELLCYLLFSYLFA